MSSSRSAIKLINSDQGHWMPPQMTGPYLIDISLHAGNRWHRGSKENVAEKYSGQEMRNPSLQPVRCARRRFLTDEERVLSHVVRVGVDVDLPKLLQLLSRFRGGVESLWGIRVDVSDSWSSSWTWWT